jgi:predicted O-methyltransferase YrrM
MSIKEFKRKYRNVSTFEKISTIIKEKLERNNLKKCKILEFGVDKGISTSLFLEFCKKNNSKLYSVDVIDYSGHFRYSNWKFINCRDDDYKIINKNVDFPVDIIFLDTEHTAKHVEKIFFSYFKKLKKNGLFIIDDISWIPYLENKNRNNEWIENNNKETFYKILDILNSNENNIKVEFLFRHSGMTIITKISNKIQKSSKIVSREFSMKNIIKKLIKK